MPETYLNFSNYQTELRINGIKKKYLKNLVELIESKYSDSIIALGIFGSIARGTADDFSDVDLLIIYSDTIPKSIKKKMIKKFIGLERAYNFQLKEKSFNNVFLRSILHLTGMFRSFFLTNESEWKGKNFKEIFNVGVFLNTFAPKNLVLLSLLNDILWILPESGSSIFREQNDENYENEIKLLFTTSSFWIEWIRGYLIAQLLTLGALFITPFFKESTKFSIEAIKWAKLSCNMLDKIRISKNNEKMFYKIYKDKIPLKKKYVARKINLETYNSLRNNYRRDPKINLFAIYHVWKIFHLMSK